MRGAELNPGGAGVEQGEHLLRHLLRGAGEGEAVQHMVGDRRRRRLFIQDSTELANPPTNHLCASLSSTNQVGGRLEVLGFPVSAASRLTPRYSTNGLGAPLTAPFTG